jgi:N6-adenosine-specific RNA methylase IME4
MTTWPFANLHMFGYRVILADPPWLFENWSEKGEEKNPLAHYGCSKTAEIAKFPVSQLASGDGAVCVMWATAPMLPDALKLLEAWGFQYKTAGAWAKLSKSGQKLAFGTGYIYRSAAEFFLVGQFGDIRPLSRSIRNLIGPADITDLAEWAIASPIREHSRKPEQMYEAIEALFEGPYVELFARQRRAGWDAWGNQVGKFEDSPNAA